MRVRIPPAFQKNKRKKMDYEAKIKKIDALIAELKALKSCIKRRQKIHARECSTPHQHEKRHVDMTWEGMAKEAAEDEAHALAVELGIADRRSDDSYGEFYFQPSPLHKYKRIKRKPSDFQNW